jgi:hypothetical protein
LFESKKYKNANLIFIDKMLINRIHYTNTMSVQDCDYEYTNREDLIEDIEQLENSYEFLNHLYNYKRTKYSIKYRDELKNRLEEMNNELTSMRKMLNQIDDDSPPNKKQKQEK